VAIIFEHRVTGGTFLYVWYDEPSLLSPMRNVDFNEMRKSSGLFQDFFAVWYWNYCMYVRTLENLKTNISISDSPKE